MEEVEDEDYLVRYPVAYIGPTFKRDADGRFIIPEHSLGWEIAGWVTEYMLDPNSTTDDPQPFRFTNEQFRMLLHWYAVDSTGRFTNRIGVIQRLKGWGKDPFLAIISLVELCGPSRFSHWGEDGDPVGRPHPNAWVQVVAVSQQQTTNTFELFPRLMSEQFKNDYGIIASAEIIRANGGRCRLVAVTASYRSLEGGRVTFTLLNETQHWVSGNQGDKMFETIRSNATKGGNRIMAITNAFLPGEDSVAEKMRTSYEDILEGRAPDVGYLYDSIESHPETPLTPPVLKQAIAAIRGDSIWVKPIDIIGEIMQSDVSPARSRRMWLNQVVTDDDALFAIADLDNLIHADGELLPGDEIVMGFDGGRSHDGTALIAIRVRDSLAWPLLIEERPSEWPKDMPWEVNRDKVDSVVRNAFSKYKVSAFYADVNLWESYIANWGADYGSTVRIKSNVSKDGNPFGWDMRGAGKRVTMANELLMSVILQGDLKLPKPRGLALSLRRHMLNARRRENLYGVSFDKESRKSPKKVDAYAALLLAHTALNDLRQKAKPEKQRTGRAWFF